MEAGVHGGPGEFVSIPSFQGCGCHHSCVHLDDFELNSQCVCEENSVLSPDGVSCIGKSSHHSWLLLMVKCVIEFGRLSLHYFPAAHRPNEIVSCHLVAGRDAVLVSFSLESELAMKLLI